MKCPGRGYKRWGDGWAKNVKFNKKGALVAIDKRRSVRITGDFCMEYKPEWRPEFKWEMV